MCDLRLIDETASLGFSNRRFGIPIMCGGTVRLPKLIGYSRAMDMILTGRFIDAKEAFEFGLANRIVSCGCGKLNLKKKIIIKLFYFLKICFVLRKSLLLFCHAL